MIIKRWKSGSGDVLIVMEESEFTALRNRLMGEINKHFPGDGTCNVPAYGIARAICRKTYEEQMTSVGMFYPGEGKADRITLHLHAHDYTDFQDLLNAWFGDWDMGSKIVCALWGRVMDNGMFINTKYTTEEFMK